jgi:predicted  nucleic acid-binding Zn-ribbon protein
MAELAPLFRELHRLRAFAKDLQDQVARVPQVLKAHQARITRQEENLREAQETLKKLKVKNLDRESRLKTTYQQLSKHETQLKTASGAKEYDALKKEIATERQSCQALEDEVLEAMADIEERTAQIPELEKALEQAKSDYVQFEKSSVERRSMQESLLKDARQKLQEIEKTVPEDVRVVYERLVKAWDEGALSKVVPESRTCLACHQSITAQQYNDLLAGRLALCKSCGRILYLPE